MDFVLSGGPFERGRKILESLAAVKRPEFLSVEGPKCPECGSVITDKITEKMNIHGVEYCPVCVLQDVYPTAVPLDLGEISSQQELESAITSAYSTPPPATISESRPYPGAYVLWCPPLSPDQLSQEFNRIQQLKSQFATVLNAANGNGLLYVGQSQDVVNRIWQHCRGAGTPLTSVCTPHKLVAINWLRPGNELLEIENRVGQWVTTAVRDGGYDIQVHWA
jgi:predicted GIY-YIG superfamily endonuclease